jgi:hypothetical protein
MPGYEGMTRIDPESPVYQEVARLYRIAQEIRPGGLDRWNGELYSRTDDKYGGLTRDGTFRLSQTLVLDQLTGGEGTGDPVRQGQAVATVLHESLHARVEMDAKSEPNALRKPQSIGLDEGLTELATMADYEQFAQLAGYEDIQTPDPEYPGAVHAAGELLDRASTSDTERADLLTAAIDQPVMMRWDAIADNIVRNELGDTVPPGAEHQQAARAHLVNQMAVDEWAAVHDLNGLGPTTAQLTNEAIDNGVTQIREHYQNTPDEPYPARTPNPAAEIATQTNQQPEQQRGITNPAQPVDLTQLPPPDASTQVTNGRSPQPGNAEPKRSTPAHDAQGAQPGTTQAAAAGHIDGTQPGTTGTKAGTQPSTTQSTSTTRTDSARTSGQQGDPMRFLDNQAPAAHATRPGPALGNGSRGAGTPTGPAINHPTPTRTPTPDRGRD